jgi:hypothetical protein
MDTERSGALSEDNLLAAVPTIWPFLEKELITLAFQIADQDSEGKVSWPMMPLLLHCLVFLNRKRHSVDEIRTQFQEHGVSSDEFHLGSQIVGLRLTDEQSMAHFMDYCRQLTRDELVLDQGRLTVEQFVGWVLTNEVVKPLERDGRLKWMEKHIDTVADSYGDIFFEDLSQLLFQGSSMSLSDMATGHIVASMRLKNAVHAVLERTMLIRTGFVEALRRIDSFPAFSEEALRNLAVSTTMEHMFAGQNIVTEGHSGDSMYVLRRGRATVLVDAQPVHTIGAGTGFGESSLLFRTRRNATVCCKTPCDVLVLGRAAYQTELAKLSPEQQIGPLETDLKQFWALLTYDEARQRAFGSMSKIERDAKTKMVVETKTQATGASVSSISFKTYRNLHVRVSKSLMNAEDEAEEWDEQQMRLTCGREWTEDCKRYNLQADGKLDQSMFYDSIFQLADLWARDLHVSFHSFLRDLFDNVAEWDETRQAFQFKKVDHVKCMGELFDELKARAQAEARAAERQRQVRSG